VTAPIDPTLQSWLTALEERHLRDLTFPELRRALQALSTWYVERRSELGPGTALNSAGKRAAFALFYGPLHFLTVHRIVGELEAGRSSPSRILDLGCGTGAAGAAWAMAAGGAPILEGVDRSAWAASEASWSWRRLGLRGRARRGDLNRQRLPARGAAILAAYTINELSDDEREALLGRLLAATNRGARLLVVEPIARRISPWWDDWSAALTERAGRADTWRFSTALPELLHRLDRAAGLDHRELTARSLYLPGPS
jgi:SAM-dependent methyltransferase